MSPVINNIREFAQKTNAKLISFKFVDLQGDLHQIDSLVSNINYENNNILIHELVLTPIENRFFLDPFRSYPTIFCLCENVSDNHKLRNRFVKLPAADFKKTLMLECAIEFIAVNSTLVNADADSECNICEDYIVDPVDKLANLRSEIFVALENAFIEPIYHYANGDYHNFISFKARNFLELADNYIITKYIISNMAENYGKLVNFIIGTNNEKLSTCLNLYFYNEMFVQNFNNISAENSFEQLGLPIINVEEYANGINKINRKVGINFNNNKINPYVIFSFLNTINVRDDNIIL